MKPIVALNFPNPKFLRHSLRTRHGRADPDQVPGAPAGKINFHLHQKKLKLKLPFSAAAIAGRQRGQHRLQHADDGVGPVHLRPREGGRAEPGGHRRPRRPHQPDPAPDHRRLGHHEPRVESHCAQRFVIWIYEFMDILKTIMSSPPPATDLCSRPPAANLQH